MSLDEIIVDIECTRQKLIHKINLTFDEMLLRISTEPCDETQATVTDSPIVPITTNPKLFGGRKPVALFIGDIRIDVKSWKDVLVSVLKHCCQDHFYLEKIMELRYHPEKRAKKRLFAETADNMVFPVKIRENLYVETHHSTKDMVNALINKTLIPIGYDCSYIRVGIRERNNIHSTTD